MPIFKLMERLATKNSGAEVASVDPENIVWIFGSARTGSTWLGQMMASLKGYKLWDEPLVGVLFGDFYHNLSVRKESKHSLLVPEKSRSLPIRSFMLTAIHNKFPRVTERGHLVIKEPHGSIGAPLLMEALPESRMIFLVRDPRDVVASGLDAREEGGWVVLRSERRARKQIASGPNANVESRARLCLRRMSNSKQAYEAHEGRKVLVRYEDLRADTLATMKRIYSELEIEVDEEELERVVEEHSWENIPEEEKGPGKRRRKATPGGWREDLTPEQVRTVEEITAPLLQEFYPE